MEPVPDRPRRLAHVPANDGSSRSAGGAEGRLVASMQIPCKFNGKWAEMHRNPEAEGAGYTPPPPQGPRR
jgi:hypothetical protein